MRLSNIKVQTLDASQHMYTDEQVVEIFEKKATAERELSALFDRCFERPYKTTRGKEFAHEGLCRRLRTCTRSIHQVFEFIPPKSRRLPSKEKMTDAEACLHAFLMATYGAIDNLAWIWVSETDLKKPNGKPLPRGNVGLRLENKLVLASLPLKLRTKIEDFGGWFNQNEDYRHALAHRIPPYIPPFAIKTSDLEKFHKLNADILPAILEGDFAKKARLERRLRKLKRFEPVIQHSWGENAVPVIFHAMLIADSLTIASLTSDLFDALDTLP
jgi:hypothetical protein